MLHGPAVFDPVAERQFTVAIRCDNSVVDGPGSPYYTARLGGPRTTIVVVAFQEGT